MGRVAGRGRDFVDEVVLLVVLLAVAPSTTCLEELGHGGFARNDRHANALVLTITAIVAALTAGLASVGILANLGQYLPITKGARRDPLAKYLPGYLEESLEALAIPPGELQAIARRKREHFVRSAHNDVVVTEAELRELCLDLGGEGQCEV